MTNPLPMITYPDTQHQSNPVNIDIAQYADALMIKMGFPLSEQGPFVNKLRDHITSQVRNGLVDRSGGTWAPQTEYLSYEERAKALLAFDWAADHGYAYKRECMDRIIYRQFNTKTLKRNLVIRWSLIPAALRDHLRHYRFLLRKPFLPKNPYL